MILDQLANANRYAPLGARFARALEFLQATDLDALAPGTYELEGRDLYALVQEYSPKPLSEAGWEEHRHYADVQFIVSGTERIGYAPAESLQRDEYDAARDYGRLSGNGDLVTLHGGDFMILWPGEGHAPGLVAEEPSMVKKVVVKVRVP
jgi:YhcH/YjgK/YiaL family protein